MSCEISDVAIALAHIASFAGWFDRQDRRSVVTALLLDLGMLAKYDGFDYLVCIIPAYMEDHQRSASKELYPLAADLCRGESGNRCVERSLRKAIRSTWARGSRKARQLYFPPEIYGDTPPSNMCFIARIGRLLELWEAAG